MLFRRTTVFSIFIISLFLIFLGCEKKEFVFDENTSVDGFDISGMTYDVAHTRLLSYHEKMLSEIYYTVESDNKSVRISADRLGITFDTQGALNEAREKGGQISTKLILDEGTAREALNNISEMFYIAPQNAYAEYDKSGKFLFHESKNGTSLNVDEVCEALSDAVKSVKSETITANMNELESSGISLSELEDKYSMISEFTTYFNKDPYDAENRVNNIKKASDKVNGTVLKPGESFDTNAVLGDRNGENGWYKAPGIRNGKYELEYGGGVCQVSTTLYNAVLLANLEVVERTPHSWPIGYVDIGRDATISTGGPNLIFSNNTDSDITVASVIDDEKKSITVRIYGKKPDGYEKVVITSEQTGIIAAPEPEYVYNKDLAAGEYVTDREARDGKTAATYRTFYDASGKKIRSETVTQDKYRAFSAIIHYGA